jgi:predicted porin
MKKSLFAIAAVTAFAGAAQAQSSVTVYGLLDVGYVGGNERVSTSAGAAKQTFSTIGQSAQSTSRLGFRGTEDLGGGTSAFFNFETALTPGAATFSTLQTRAANIGLAKKGMGRATIGTQNTVVTDAIGPTLTGQFNNMTGSMIFASFTGTPTTGSTGGSSFTAAGNPNGNTDAFTFRTSSTLKLQSEKIAGFQLGAMVVLNNNNKTQGAAPAATPVGYTGGNDNQNGWGLGANYQWKKLIVTAAYQSLSAKDPFSATVAQANNGIATVGAPAAYGLAVGTNVKDNQAYAGATYDFGILKAYVSWIDRKVTSQINSNAYAKRTAQEVGVRGNFTPKIEAYASVGNGRVTTFGVGIPTANIVGYQLGTSYILSKRTNLYAIYGASGTSSASGTNNSYNANNYAIGMRHTF